MMQLKKDGFKEDYYRMLNIIQKNREMLIKKENEMFDNAIFEDKE